MKPIIFSTPMVQAILDGKKTQTRRVIKIDDAPENWKISIAGTSIVRTEPYDVKLPRYAAGDILWVRETWQHLRIKKPHRAIPMDFNFVKYIYKADGEIANSDGTPFKWRPSIHMPREAARIFLRVTNVRVERVQDITAHDAIREGMESEIPFDTVDEFKELWNNLNTKRGYGWESNPWVWVYEFEKINKE